MARPRSIRDTKEETQEVILTAARDLFLEQGFQSVSMRKVAQRVGLSPAALYTYFRDKADILFALQGEGFARLLAVQRPLQKVGDPLERLQRHGEIYLTFAFDEPTYYEVMFLLPAPRRPPDINATLTAGKAFGLLEATVADCVRAGVLAGAVEDLTLAVWAGVHGIAALLLRSRVPGIGSLEEGRLAALRAQRAMMHSLVAARRD